MSIQQKFHAILYFAIFLICLITHLFFIYLIFNESVFFAKTKQATALKNTVQGANPIHVRWQRSTEILSKENRPKPIQQKRVQSQQHTVDQRHSVIATQVSPRVTARVDNKHIDSSSENPTNPTIEKHITSFNEMPVSVPQHSLEKEKRVSVSPSIDETSEQVQAVEKTMQSTATPSRDVQISDVQIISRQVSYPSRARALGVEGRVKVKFDISNRGTVKNIQILEEAPKGLFVNDLVQEMARWRYHVTQGVTDQMVHIVFRLDGRVVVENP